jgi:hypothetical protein
MRVQQHFRGPEAFGPSGPHRYRGRARETSDENLNKLQENGKYMCTTAGRKKI